MTYDELMGMDMAVLLEAVVDQSRSEPERTQAREAALARLPTWNGVATDDQRAILKELVRWGEEKGSVG